MLSCSGSRLPRTSLFLLSPFNQIAINPQVMGIDLQDTPRRFQMARMHLVLAVQQPDKVRMSQVVMPGKIQERENGFVSRQCIQVESRLLLAELLIRPLHHCREKRVFVTEVVIQQLFVDARRAGNHIHARTIESCLAKVPGRRIENAQSARSGVSFPGCGLFLHCADCWWRNSECILTNQLVITRLNDHSQIGRLAAQHKKTVEAAR